jgi:large subunit ribosomal protein L18e
MGIDLKAGGRVQKRNFKDTKTKNPYLKLLIKLYRFLARRTDSEFNSAVYKRLNQSRTTRYPISLSRIVKNLKGKNDRTVVAVTNVTNDIRLLQVPKLTICALKVTETARKRIVEAGGQVLTFDQLALKNPTGSGCFLMRGPRSREVLRHFGLAPGQKGGHAKPYNSGKGQKR